MFEQIKLGYGFDALEPHIDELTMRTHYGKHHAGYTAKLNDAIAQLPELADKKIEDILKNLPAISDTAQRTAVKNNGGGFYNHNLYFSTMAPHGASAPTGRLADRIATDFGSLAVLKDKLTSAALGQFGSGWAWLSTDAQGNLQVKSTPNQDNPLMVDGGKWTPILSIDVWEHAYYLKYKNLRPDYVQAFFNVLNWTAVGANYDAVVK